MKKLLCLLLASLMVLAGYSEGYDGGLFMDKHNADIDSIKENNKIYYTTIDNSLMQISTKFGPNLVSNTYENGQGVLTFDGAITSIEGSAFSLCRKLASITIPDGVTSIGDGAFSLCGSLVSITIPNGVTSIGDRAFSYCSELVSITIPNSVTSIGDRAFSDCENLTSIAIPDGVTSIGSQAFKGCDKLAKFASKLASEDGRCLVVDGVLKGFAPYGVTEYSIPAGVTSIGDHAFSWCENLVSITIPNGVTSIGDEAFESCENLTSIPLPNSITSIGDGAFGYCI